MSEKLDSLREQVKAAARAYHAQRLAEQGERCYIPASGKVLGVEELDNMVDATLDMWLTAGRFNDEFEKRFAEKLGARFALTVNSGSSANLLALTALTSPKLGDKALRKGDEVIAVAAGFPTTVNPIIQNGLVPVFVDCEVGTYNIDIRKLEKAISPRTRCIFLAHTLGNCYDLERIQRLCQEHKLWLIEDSCDALGAKYAGKYAGTYGHIGTFSFYPAHHITMGEGGAVITNDAKLHRILMSCRDWGRDCWCKPGCDNTCRNRFSLQLGNLPKGYDHKYTYSHIGYNLKVTDWQAACACAQLDKLDGFIARRRANAEYLLAALSDLQDYLILPRIEENVEPSWFGFLISVKPERGISKFELVKYLEENGVGTRQLFAGNLLRQPMVTTADFLLRIGSGTLMHCSELTEEHYAQLPGTEFIMNNTFWVGCFPGLGEKELAKTAAVIHRYIEKHK